MFGTAMLMRAPIVPYILRTMRLRSTSRNCSGIPNTRSLLLLSLDNDLGCGGDGWVPEDEFSRAMTKLKERKANWDDGVNGVPFPYEDGSFSFLS